jgi:uncharacterized repeat protein (TIGR01451 family)
LRDAFVAKLDNTLTSLLYSTFLGGSDYETCWGVAVDAAGSAYAVGHTESADFPVRRAPQSTLSGTSDMFVTKLHTSGGPLLYSTYWGGIDGSQGEHGLAIAVDNAGTAYATGQTSSTSFPTVNPFQAAFAGNLTDAVVVKATTSADVRITMTDSPDPVALGGTLTYTMTITNLGPDAATNVRVTDVLTSEVTFVSVTPSQGFCTGTLTVVCTLGLLDTGSATIELRVRPVSSGGSISNTATVTRFEPDPVSANNSATVTTATTGGFLLRVVVNTQTGGGVSSSPIGISCGTDCLQAFASGTTVRLVAKPAVGWQFNYWLGHCSGPNPVCYVSMTANKSVTAIFSLIQ